MSSVSDFGKSQAVSSSEHVSVSTADSGRLIVLLVSGGVSCSWTSRSAALTTLTPHSFRPLIKSERIFRLAPL